METYNDYRASEQERRSRSSTDIGVITDVDWAGKRIRISPDGGTTKTDWLSWPAEVGRNYVRWRPLREGQGVVYLAVGEDLSQAQVVGMIYTSDIPSPNNDPDVDLIQFVDGTALRYDIGNSALSIVSAGAVTVIANANCMIHAEGILQVTSVGNMLVKSDERLILKGALRTMIL